MNSYGGKTHLCSVRRRERFESSVNSYGGKTIKRLIIKANGLRVV